MSLLHKSTKLTTAIFRTSSSPNPQTSINFIRGFKSTASKMTVHNLANKAEYRTALKDNKVVVLDCFATWCGPCKVIAPQVAKFSEEFSNVHFVKVDVDEVPDVAQELNIRAMPTFVIFKNGEVEETIVGANPKALQAAIEKHKEEA